MGTLTTPSPQPSDPAPKIEYDRLIAYFHTLVKITGSLLGLVILAGGVFLWQNTHDIKEQAAAAIKATQDTATAQISAIGQTAQDTAKSAAQKAIEAALDKPNTQRLIQDTVREKVNTAVEAEIQKTLGAKIEAFRTMITKIGEIANHGAQLRLGFRSGLDALLKERQDPDPTVRAYAQSTLTEIAADYETSIPTRPQLLPTDYPTKFLMGEIKVDNGPFAPSRIAEAFQRLKTKTAWDVPMFDIPAAEKWCAEHKPKCDE